MVPIGDGGVTTTGDTDIMKMWFDCAAALGDRVEPDSKVVGPTSPEPASVPFTFTRPFMVLPFSVSVAAGATLIWPTLILEVAPKSPLMFMMASGPTTPPVMVPPVMSRVDVPSITSPAIVPPLTIVIGALAPATSSAMPSILALMTPLLTMPPVTVPSETTMPASMLPLLMILPRTVLEVITSIPTPALYSPEIRYSLMMSPLTMPPFEMLMPARLLVSCRAAWLMIEPLTVDPCTLMPPLGLKDIGHIKPSFTTSPSTIVPPIRVIEV